MREHTSKETVTSIASRTAWYIYGTTSFYFPACSFRIGQDLFYALQVAENGGVDIPDVEVWQMAHKKNRELKGGEDPYYGSTSEDLSDYEIR